MPLSLEEIAIARVATETLNERMQDEIDANLDELDCAVERMQDEINADRDELEHVRGCVAERKPAPPPEPAPAPAPPPVAPTPAPPAVPAPPAQRRDGWTPERQVAFLEALAETHNIAAAAQSVGMTRQSAYKLRVRLRGEPFDLAWDAAFQTRFDTLAEVAMERAINGIEVPHFHKGELVHTSRRFDERLTVALLAQRAAPRRTHSSRHHPASQFGQEDFRKLVTRVGHGPATWYPDHRPDPDTARD